MTYTKLAKEIKNVRHAENNKINFDFRGTTIAINHPKNVLLVGFKGAEIWLAQQYGLILNTLNCTVINTESHQ